ncbi:MAG: ATP-binding protein [Deltaproteobacteria bacterium]|nr:ATP-binding protein [Deltaproteobacteria bacterium]
MKKTYTDQDILEILKLSELFKQFDNERLKLLIRYSSVEYFNKDSVVIEEGTTNDKVFVILDGSVAVYTGEDFILGLTRKGDLVGEMSVISQNPTTASVIADTPVSLFTISKKVISGSGNEVLKYTLNKVFLDILTDKLTLTSKQVRGFKATKEELALSEDHLYDKTLILQSILESMSDGVVVIGENRQILQVNDSFKQMIGNVDLPLSSAKWAEKIGFYNSDKVTPFDIEDLSMMKSVIGFHVDSLEIFLKNDQVNEEVWLQASSRPLVSKSQTDVKGAVIVFRDITKAKMAELALIKAKESAEAVSKAKSDFLSVMSHELRTPLNAILGMADLMHQTDLNEEQKDFIDSIKTGGDALLAIVKNILDYNDLESQSMKISPRSFSLRGCLREVIRHHESMAKSKKIQIELKLAEDFPDQVIGDENKLSQVLMNLINNALKFTNQGMINIDGEIHKKGAEEMTALFWVTDTGIGIPQDQYSKLFQPFVQVDSTLARKFEGTGLGLAISRRIIQLLGGEIWFDSEPGKGSAFFFTVPLKQDRSQQEQAKVEEVVESVQVKYSTDFAANYPYKILVAEDNKMNQKLIKKVLSKLGYESRLAENGFEAVLALRKEHFDLILMDLQMPEMDGQEAAKMIRQESGENNDLKIIALTANIVDGIKESCLESGMDDYMAKPLRIDKLAAMLQKWSDAS